MHKCQLSNPACMLSSLTVNDSIPIATKPFTGHLAQKVFDINKLIPLVKGIAGLGGWVVVGNESGQLDQAPHGVGLFSLTGFLPDSFDFVDLFIIGSSGIASITQISSIVALACIALDDRSNSRFFATMMDGFPKISIRMVCLVSKESSYFFFSTLTMHWLYHLQLGKVRRHDRWSRPLPPTTTIEEREDPFPNLFFYLLPSISATRSKDPWSL